MQRASSSTHWPGRRRCFDTDPLSTERSCLLRKGSPASQSRVRMVSPMWMSSCCCRRCSLESCGNGDCVCAIVNGESPSLLQWLKTRREQSEVAVLDEQPSNASAQSRGRRVRQSNPVPRKATIDVLFHLS